MKKKPDAEIISKDIFRYLLLLMLLLTFSCGDEPAVEPDPEPDPEPETPTTYPVGFSWYPEKPDADSPITIVFKASGSSDLQGYQGEAYIHIGIVSKGVWLYVPAEWNENTDKCRMKKVTGETDTWQISLSPSVREWFGSGTTPVNRIGMVVRSADGTKKGIDKDSFIEEITDSRFKAFEPAAQKQGTLPPGLDYGINIIDDHTVTLVLYDRDRNGAGKDYAHVVGDFNDWQLSNNEKSQMCRDEAAGCWWITINGLDPAKEYSFQYYVGNRNEDPLRVADPYARKILDPDNDPNIPASTYPEALNYPSGALGIVSVFRTRPETYAWQVDNFEAPQKEQLVIYELLLRDFTASSDLNGAMNKLDYLQSLGVNAIELMPVQEFDGNDSWGYNPSFYFALDKAYGTDQMYREFIDECHKRGIAVIFDVVYNHATGSNPFAKLWWNADANQTAPENPFFNEKAPHPYGVFHDFDHEAEVVRLFVKRNLQFLLEEYHIDGFRFDLTKGFTNRASNESTAADYDASRIAILEDYYHAVTEVKPDAYVILEHFCDDNEEKELSEMGMMVWRNMNHAYCQSAMGYKEESDFTAGYYRDAGRPANSMVTYMESHDEERMAYKQITWGVDALKNNAASRMSQLAGNASFFLTVPGPKMIWQFGETGYDISINENGRTGKKPVKWEYAEDDNRKVLLDTYRKLIALRADHPELFNATAEVECGVTTSFWETGRYISLSSFGGNKHAVITGNFTDHGISATIHFPATGSWNNYLNPGTTLYVPETTMERDMAPNSFVVYVKFDE